MYKTVKICSCRDGVTFLFDEIAGGMQDAEG
jgi:hypothetical protein